MVSDPIVLMFARAGKSLLEMAESLEPETPASPLPRIVETLTERKVMPSLLDEAMLFDSITGETAARSGRKSSANRRPLGGG